MEKEMLLLKVNEEKDPEISAELQCPLPKDAKQYPQASKLSEYNPQTTAAAI